MVGEGLITREEAVMRVTPAHIDQCLHPRLDPKAAAKVIATGLAASPGAAVGRAVFDADAAVELGKKDRVILVRKETTPDDIHGMDAAQGILTMTGGATSHASVVARGMGKPCIVGASSIRVDDHHFSVDGLRVEQGDWIALDGSTGRVMLGQVKTIEPDLGGEFGTFLSWTDAFRRLKVRANADIPRDAKQARQFGAEGIGLCRTEHMFFAQERLPHVVAMIMAAPEAKTLESELKARVAQLDAAEGEAARTLKREVAALRKRMAGPLKAYRGALAKLLPFQRADFRGLFVAMDGHPVTIRTLDPPLHEFLPRREELMAEVAVLRADWERAKRKKKSAAKPAKLGKAERLLERVEALHEFNPMLGHRGCRLGITYPEITEMQARAIFEAACECAQKGIRAIPEVMIPLVGHVAELRDQGALVRRVAEEVMAKRGVSVEYLVGTMIEVPRAAVTADQIAAEAEFFSFGTNDLTQMTFGFSRDDAGKFLPDYVGRKILPGDPFVSIDVEGVGKLVELTVERGRAARAGIKLGICGEHGGDPASIEFFHRAGLDYVSCSPFRVPVARLAAAQAAVRGQAATSDQR
jgi:pyruvate,orthophosphate dikinase